MDGHVGGGLGAVLAAGHADAEERGAGVLHDGAHVGEVEVDQTGDRDEVGDALHAVAEDVVGVLERLDDTGVAFHHLQEAVVGDADDRVGDVPEDVDALQGLAQAAIALEAERLGDDGDGHAAELARDLSHDRRAAGARAAAFAGGDEHEVGAAQRGLELVARDLHGFAPDVGVRPAAETVRDLLPDVDLDVGVAHAELLHVGVDGDELDALDARVDHAVDRVRARAADADDLDGRHVGPSFDDRVLGAALARHATPVGAPEELAQSILHARTICHSAPPAQGRGTIRPLCLWDRTSAPRPR